MREDEGDKTTRRSPCCSRCCAVSRGSGSTIMSRSSSSSSSSSRHGLLLLLLLLLLPVVSSTTAFILGPHRQALSSLKHHHHHKPWRRNTIPALGAWRRQHNEEERREDIIRSNAKADHDDDDAGPPPVLLLLNNINDNHYEADREDITCNNNMQTKTTSKHRRATSSTTRRAHVLAGSLLAGAMTAGLLNLGSKATIAQAAEMPLYMDREVWAPLEDYMQVDERDRQTTFSPKFTAYLARLLINYDYASMSWWQRKTLVAPESARRIDKLLTSRGFEATFEELDLDEDTFISRDELRAALSDPQETQKREQQLLAQLQASVNFGLVRYQGKDGVSRLVRLLRSEFGINRIGKRQLALLFSLMDNLQPVEAIKQLIAEAEDASIVAFNVTYPGFGYNADEPPKVTISPSPGRNVSAEARVKLAPTGRILKIVLDQPIQGFSSTPKLEISPPAAEGGVRAVCIPKMNGDTVERIILSNPGAGYTENDRVSVIITQEGQPTPWNVRQARPLLEMKVAEIEVLKGGAGYAHDLPINVEISKPPFPVSAVATAKATALVSEPRELILRSWLPPQNFTIPVTGLLPNNLVPKYDPCLERFIVSPVEELDPNYCIYFEDEFKVVPSQKFSKYFSFLDGPKARDPVEKERELDPSVFWRFAACGALCCSTAHAILIPLDVVKTKMQANPAKYPSVVSTTKRILDDGGPKALLQGAGPTIIGYLVYGAVSFGLTEYFKRLFLEKAGPEYATFYPFAILLLASMSAAFFGAVAVTPFEALRIRSVTASENSNNENTGPTSFETGTIGVEPLDLMPTSEEGEGEEEDDEEEEDEYVDPNPEQGLVAALASAVAAGGMGNDNNNNNNDGSSQSIDGSSSGGAVSLGMAATISDMAKEGSLGELFAGLGPAVVGEIPFMMAKFAVFDAVSKAIYGVFPTANESVFFSLAISLMSGMTAGVAAAVVSHPFDTLTTKVTQYSQMRRSGGPIGAVKDIYASAGVAGFFKGTVPRAVKSAANIALQFFLYDFSKRALHVSADDLKLFFDVMSGLSPPTN